MIAVLRRCACLALGAATLLLQSCGSIDPLPDYRYFRLPAPAEVPARSGYLLDKPVEVQAFRADGLFGERPMVYSFEPEPDRLLQYHYQLWGDPPGAFLQRRFVDLMQAHRLSALVSARTSPRAEPVVLSGYIERLERIKPASTAAPWRVAVRLRLRLEPHRALRPTLERVYEEQVAVNGADINASVQAFGQAIDQLAARFVADIANPP
jgi:ABC-type uncharacterized transport system auxiliary subunit